MNSIEPSSNGEQKCVLQEKVMMGKSFQINEEDFQKDFKSVAEESETLG